MEMQWLVLGCIWIFFACVIGAGYIADAEEKRGRTTARGIENGHGR